MLELIKQAQNLWAFSHCAFFSLELSSKVSQALRDVLCVARLYALSIRAPWRLSPFPCEGMQNGGKSRQTHHFLPLLGLPLSASSLEAKVLEAGGNTWRFP